jgi:hypothetical protein
MQGRENLFWCDLRQLTADKVLLCDDAHSWNYKQEGGREVTKSCAYLYLAIMLL